MGAQVTKVVAALPGSPPFIAPEEIERKEGLSFSLRLGANENVFGPSPRAIRAAQDALTGIYRYGEPRNFELRRRLADATGRPSSEIAVGSGIDDLLSVAVRCLMAPGENAVTTCGTYPTFAHHVATHGGIVHEVPYAAEFRLDTDALARLAVRTRARIVYLANPDNPTGSVVAEPTIARLAGQIPSGCTLLVDEAYRDFASREEGGDSQSERTVRFRTFSKAHALAGLRIGYALAPDSIATAFDKVRLHFGVNRVAQAAALASLDDEQHLQAVVRAVTERRPEYERLGRAQGWRPLPSQTNFVAFDVGSGERSAWLVQALQSLSVFIRRGGQPPVDRCIRVTVGTRMQCEQLEQTLELVRGPLSEVA